MADVGTRPTTSKTMATIDRSFVDGMFWRMCLLGVAVAALGAVFISWRIGVSVALGTAVGAASLRVTTVVIERLMDAVIDGAEPSPVWALLLVLKLLALLTMVAVCVVVLDADPIAFVIGFKLILPALGWQLFRDPGHLDGPVDDADDTEST